MIKEELFKRLTDKKDRIISIRRHLHEYPELSFHETNTSKYIQDFYKDKDCTVETYTGGNGVRVTIDSGKPGKTLAIRADFDALPITEETGLPFASKNKGVMHACGHDGHTAYMLILAETLIEMKDQLDGKIVVLHQPAEEVPPGGALQMIKDGALDGVDNVLGIHVMSTMDTGGVFYREGAIQTGRSYFKVTIHGKGGHGSSPHMANDAIVAASYFVTAVQTVVSRRLNPFDVGTVTIGSFDGKGQFNVIKDSVSLEGDVRAMTEETRTLIQTEITRILDGLQTMYGITYDLNYQNDYPVLMNDEKLTAFVSETLKEANINEVSEVTRCEPQPPSEDFAYYAEKLPSCFFYVGAKPANGNFYPHHHPKFDINEDCLLIAAKAMGAVVAEYLKGRAE
ncbi:M20/M25/M40 family peptidase [Listeria floridensis FSL S10-1187]|uniref:M20/M25/M40 family peptidase n=1 Tax=Listeria floridensis FSL S10-1187 TaxID=1265817 RepID=A0ABP3AXQ1_9LIST|nr:M20 family metallopeptidase [Listeria floridensis]EUJ28502.1 M20/M25/M40 family peptidase [Listeria floridensis FSL S10-1187]